MLDSIYTDDITEWDWSELNEKVVKIFVHEADPESLEPKRVYLMDEFLNFYLVLEEWSSASSSSKKTKKTRKPNKGKTKKPKKSVVKGQKSKKH